MYPKPDRSNLVPNLAKRDEEDVLDLGWSEGVLSDGRPYRVECWAQYQITTNTYFFSRQGLEQLSNDAAAELLLREGLLEYTSPKRPVEVHPFTDTAGNELWSVNVVVGDEEGTFVRDHRPLQKY